MAEHTPTPWRQADLDSRLIWGASRIIAAADTSQDAAHIVRCVNSHDVMERALRTIASDENVDIIDAVDLAIEALGIEIGKDDG